MEAEATAGYMSVLLSYAELEEPQTAPALGQLDSFCMTLIASAASSMSLINGGSTELRDMGLSLPPPAPPLESWLCSLRAVNLARAIQLLLPSNDRRQQNLHRPASQSNAAAGAVEGNVWLMELWPHMVSLMCSPHAAVRHAVADYFCLGVAAAAGLISVKDSRG